MILIKHGYRLFLTNLMCVFLFGVGVSGWLCLGCRTDETKEKQWSETISVSEQDRARLLKSLWSTKGEGWLLPPEEMKSGQMTSLLQSLYDKNGEAGRTNIHFSFDPLFRDNWLYAVNLTEGDRLNYEHLARDMQDNMWYTVTRYCRRFGMNFRILSNEIVFYVPTDYYSPDLDLGRSGHDGRLPDGRYRISDAFFYPKTTNDLWLLSTLKSRSITGFRGVPRWGLKEFESIFKQDVCAFYEIRPPFRRKEVLPVEFDAEIRAKGLIPVCIDPVQTNINDNLPHLEVPVLEFILQMCRTYGLKFYIDDGKIKFVKPFNYYSPDISKETVKLVPEILRFEHELEQWWELKNDINEDKQTR
ncbi:MAG: hypothetical protein EOM51_10500 [Clostridia bacterium]|jgi:hypothetical protein|nr:hypothetical protein [Clostridia bacterium]